jgi:hypothetical protein
MANFKQIEELEKRPIGDTFYSTGCEIDQPKVAINDVAGFHLSDAKSWDGNREVRVVNSNGHVIFTLTMRATWKDDDHA